MKPINELKNLYAEYHALKSPEFHNAFGVVYPTYFSKSKTTGGLTRCIIAYIRLNGWHAERINTTGRPIDNRKIVTDVIGRTRQIGTMQWIPGTGTPGSADISARICGKGVSIEVKNKITRDRMSPAQKDYKTIMEFMRDIYYVATDFDSFYFWFEANFSRNPEYIKLWEFMYRNKNYTI